MINHSYDNFFANFANKTKFHIIMTLREKPLNVTQIAKKTNLEQSKVSHNLRKLTACHILDVKQIGKQRVYSLNTETVIPILKIMEKHIKNHCKGCHQR